ncbi:MAG: PepSY domain-containing protein, partial [Rhodospirillaceae bacterium]
MTRIALAAAVVAVLPTAAFAGANCKANPKAEWMSEADAKAKLVAQGYKID